MVLPPRLADSVHGGHNDGTSHSAGAAPPPRLAESHHSSSSSSGGGIGGGPRTSPVQDIKKGSYAASRTRIRADSAPSVRQRKHLPVPKQKQQSRSRPASPVNVVYQIGSFVASIGGWLFDGGDKFHEDLAQAMQDNDYQRLNSLLDQGLGSPLMSEDELVQKAALKLASQQLRETLQTDDPMRLKGAILAAKRLKAIELPEFEAAVQRYQELNQLPSSWDVSRLIREKRGSRLVVKSLVSDQALRHAFQGLLDASHRLVWTRDRGQDPVPARLVLVRVVEVANSDLWMDYTKRQEEIRIAVGSETLDKIRPATLVGDDSVQCGRDEVWPDSRCVEMLSHLSPSLDGNLNEVLLFHGTSPIAGEEITNGNFRVNMAGSTTGTLYGRGIYLAENATKSDEYSSADPDTNLRTLLVCRTTLGRVRYNNEKNPDPRACEIDCHCGLYHSVLGDRRHCRGTFREFVIFDEDQVYPNFIITYKRSMAPIKDTE